MAIVAIEVLLISVSPFPIISILALDLFLRPSTNLPFFLPLHHTIFVPPIVLSLPVIQGEEAHLLIFEILDYRRSSTLFVNKNPSRLSAPLRLEPRTACASSKPGFRVPRDWHGGARKFTVHWH